MWPGWIGCNPRTGLTGFELDLLDWVDMDWLHWIDVNGLLL